jgi:hypothetical protein
MQTLQLHHMKNYNQASLFDIGQYEIPCNSKHVVSWLRTQHFAYFLTQLSQLIHFILNNFCTATQRCSGRSHNTAGWLRSVSAAQLGYSTLQCIVYTGRYNSACTLNAHVAEFQLSLWWSCWSMLPIVACHALYNRQVTNQCKCHTLLSSDWEELQGHMDCSS